MSVGEASKTPQWSYVATVHKPTSVTHSCAGNFTGPQDRNIIIAKCTCIEILLLTTTGTALMLDVPTHGRIAALELFHPRGALQDLLLLVTESCRFCILQWDGAASVLITRAKGSVLDRTHSRMSDSQIVIVDPDYRLIGFYLYAGIFKVIPFDEGWKPHTPFNLRLENLQVLDIKFLFGGSEPMIVVLEKDNNDGRHVKTYLVDVESKVFNEGPWSLCDLYNGAGLIIPVPSLTGGAIIIGEETIVYHNGTKLTAVALSPSIIRAYARIFVDCSSSRYLLSDSEGYLYSLAIQHKQERSGLKIEELGKTSVVSTLCCPDETIVYVGSSYEDSQLIKLYVDPHGKHQELEVLQTYFNLGPIEDLCVADLADHKSQRQVFTCSGAYRERFRTVGFSSGFNEMASLKFDSNIKDIWSLRVPPNNPHDTLVVNVGYNTKILQMDPKCGLVETRIKGFDTCDETLFCSNAVSDQLVQVTSEYVRLISSTSGELWDKWAAPSQRSIILASGDAFQVLLATEENWLVSVTIGKEYLNKKSETQVEEQILCLEMHQTTSRYLCNTMAVVGTSTGSVSIYHIPSMIINAKVHLEGEIIPRSVLLCGLEGVCYLFCSHEDGHLSKYVYDWKNLTGGEKVLIGTKRFKLRLFFSEGKSKVFAASDTPTVIYCSDDKLFYSKLIVEGASDMCPSNSAAIPGSLAIAKEKELSVGTIISKVDIHVIRLREHAQHSCHQEQSRTFGICTNCQMWTEETGRCSVRLLDDQTFEVKSTHELEPYECGFSILSCSFTDDSNVYYCVGTGYFSYTKGRILVFIVDKDKNLKLVASNETEGAVNRLNASNGKLLADIDQKIQIYKLTLHDDGSHELGNHNNVQSSNKCLVSELMKPNPWLLLEHEGKHKYYKKKAVTAVEVLGDNVYVGANVGANNKHNLFTIRKDGIRDTGEQGLPKVNEYPLGQLISQFRHGPLIKLCLDFRQTGVHTLIFGTAIGMIGVIACLPPELYDFLNKLQSYLTDLKTGVGGLSHKEWQSSTKKNSKKKKKSEDAFVDGDLIVTFLDLDRECMMEISKKMNFSVEKICYIVQVMSRVL